MFQSNLRQLGGVFGLSWGVLEASWGVLEASWRRLGGILDASWGILGTSWTCLRENVERRSSAIYFLEGFGESKCRQKKIKTCVKKATCFSFRFCNVFFVIFTFLKVSW